MPLATKLKQLQDRLNQLSKNNRNIRFTELHKPFIDLTIMPQRKDVSPSDLLDYLFSRPKGKEFQVTDSKSPLSEETRWTNQFKDLNKEWTLRNKETGERDLYVGFPFLSGTLQDQTFVHAPLLYYPVELIKQDGNWHLAFDEEGEIIWNRALMLHVQQANMIRILDDKFEAALPFSDPFDIQEYLSKLWNWGLPIQSPLPTQQVKNLVSLDEYLTPLRTVSVKEEKKSFSWDNLAVPLTIVPHAILGQFSQGKKGISKDYQALIKEVEGGSTADLISVLLNETAIETREFDVRPPHHVDEGSEEDHFFLLPSDSSQEEVVLAARYERRVVIDGPPGSGKSQVIVNLMADTLRHNKPVLLVAEKRAALTVVHQRLQEIGLTDFVALVHDEKEDRRVLYDKIVKQVGSSPESTWEQVKEEFTKCSTEIASKTAYLNSIARTLWSPQPNDLSLFQMYDRYLPYRENDTRFRLPSTGYSLKITELEQIKKQLERLGRYASRYRHREYPWAQRASFAEMTLDQRNQWLDLLDALLSHEEQECILRQQFETWNVPFNYLQRHGAAIKQGRALLQQAIIGKFFAKWFWKLWARKHQDFLRRLGGTSELDWEARSEQFAQICAWRESRERVEQVLKELSSLFPDPILKNKTQGWHQGESIREWLQELRHTLLTDWDALKQADREVAELPAIVLSIYETCMQEFPPTKNQPVGTHWWEQVEKAYLEHWIHSTEAANPTIHDLSEGEYESHRQQYGEILDRKRDVAAAYLRMKLQQTLTSVEEKARKDITYRCGQKKQVWPIRRLLETHPDVLSKIVPIWLVSPEIASTVFPLQKDLFDLVIFDEASQCPAEHGIPALFRGRRVVIAGDDKQLRPTKIGKKSYVMDEDDEDYIEDIQTAESLLDLAVRTFTRKSLQWHYRSKFEELINFSNHAFYKNIQVAPNVQPTQDPPAIQWFHVDRGLWVDNANMEEAKKVVDLIAAHYQGQNDQSLGVVTMNQKQQELVETLIKKRVADDPEFATAYQQVMSRSLDKKLIVRNIENIQGDERDIMIFSITYARDVKGDFHARFGSLNQAGGENRLNVAITRAKEGIWIVASVLPLELPGDEQNPGIYFFKRYLEYAYEISQRRPQDAETVLARMNSDYKMRLNRSVSLRFDSAFEQEVFEALEAKGYTVHTQVGASTYRIDLAVVDPANSQRYILGIECDGAMYHSSKTARERDVTRQRFLENRGWVIERIWSRNWWRRPQDEIARIERRIQELVKQSESELTAEV